MSAIEKFISYLDKGSSILDLGCGVGRDTKYFSEKGFNVIAVEYNGECRRIASEYTGLTVRKLQIDELDYENCFSGVWVRSSLINVPKQDLIQIFHLIAKALMPQGYTYFSFKHGQFKSDNCGATYFTDATLKEFFKTIDEFEIVDIWTDYDNRPCSNDKWLNVIVKLKN